MTITATRTHGFSYGHRVCGHETKCQHLHGHNGKVTFHCDAPNLDKLGRVIDFGVIKTTLCQWLEDNWDHRFIVFERDPFLAPLQMLDPVGVVSVPFNPTAENLANHLLYEVGPLVLKGTNVKLTKVEFMETEKCGVVVS